MLQQQQHPRSIFRGTLSYQLISWETASALSYIWLYPSIHPTQGCTPQEGGRKELPPETDRQTGMECFVVYRTENVEQM